MLVTAILSWRQALDVDDVTCHQHPRLVTHTFGHQRLSPLSVYPINLPHFEIIFEKNWFLPTATWICLNEIIYRVTILINNFEFCCNIVWNKYLARLFWSSRVENDELYLGWILPKFDLLSWHPRLDLFWFIRKYPLQWYCDKY